MGRNGTPAAVSWCWCFDGDHFGGKRREKLHSRAVVWCRIESAGRDFGLSRSRSAKLFLFSAQLCPVAPVALGPSSLNAPSAMPLFCPLGPFVRHSLMFTAYIYIYQKEFITNNTRRNERVLINSCKGELK